MKEESVTFQFEKAHATVVFTNKLSEATGKMHAKLYVQAIDQYRYQREWILEFRHEPGNSQVTYWESHIYMHPGRRHIVKVGASQAEECVKRFLYLCAKYPALLFNETGDHAEDKARPRSEGFVQFAEALHRGMLPSKTML